MAIQAHFVHRLGDPARRGIFAQIDNQALAARFEHAIHLLECAERVREVLERGTAKDKVKAVLFEWHSRRVPLPKIHIDFRFLRVPVRDLNKRLADVETGDMVAAEFGQFDGEYPGPGATSRTPRSSLPCPCLCKL